MDLGNSEEGCIPPYQTVSNKELERRDVTRTDLTLLSDLVDGCLPPICDFLRNKTCHNDESNGFEYEEWLEQRDLS